MSDNPSVPLIAESDAKAYLLLQGFVGDSDLDRLELLLGKFNLFEAMNWMRQEIRHSAFLAYLLDPQQNHGLGDVFLKTLLKRALAQREFASLVDGLTPMHIDVCSLANAEIHCEWQNIDVFVRDEANKLAIIIENKIDSGEHDDQLARYITQVRNGHGEWRIVPIYLTIDGESPTDERYISLGYDVVCHVIETIIHLRRSTIDPDVRVLLEHYIGMLRRHFLSESEIAKLCQQLYARHKEALDLIYEHRPDRVQRVKEFLEADILKNGDLALDHTTKSYIRFIPKEIDFPILRQGAGWTPSKRMLLFELQNTDKQLAVKLVIGPGPSDIREKLFELAKHRPFDNPPQLYPQWTMIYKRTLLSKNAYSLEDEAFYEKLSTEWEEFSSKQLPVLVAALKDVTWMHDCVDAERATQADVQF